MRLIASGMPPQRTGQPVHLQLEITLGQLRHLAAAGASTAISPGGRVLHSHPPPSQSVEGDCQTGNAAKHSPGGHPGGGKVSDLRRKAAGHLRRYLAVCVAGHVCVQDGL